MPDYTTSHPGKAVEKQPRQDIRKRMLCRGCFVPVFQSLGVSVRTLPMFHRWAARCAASSRSAGRS